MTQEQRILLNRRISKEITTDNVEWLDTQDLLAILMFARDAETMHLCSSYEVSDLRRFCWPKLIGIIKAELAWRAACALDKLKPTQ